MNDTNGFGYVEIKDGMVVCHTGESNNETLFVFEDVLGIGKALKLRDIMISRGNEPDSIGKPFDQKEWSYNDIKGIFRSMVKESERLKK